MKTLMTSILMTLTLAGCGADDEGAHGQTPDRTDQTRTQNEDPTIDNPGGATPVAKTNPSAANPLAALGVTFTSPGKAAVVDDLTVAYKAETMTVVATYNFALTAAMIDQQLASPLALNEQMALQPTGTAESAGQGKYAAFSNQEVKAAVGGVVRKDDDIGGLVVFAVTKNDAAAASAAVKALLASVAFQPMQQDQAAQQFLEQGWWKHEDYYSSTGGVGSGFSSSMTYVGFCKGRFSQSNNTSIGVDVGGNSQFDQGESSGPQGRYYVFAGAADSHILVLVAGQGGVESLVVKLRPNGPDGPFIKAGEKTFYELTGQASCHGGSR